MPALCDLQDKIYGDCLVLRRDETPRNTHDAWWIVRCVCGREVSMKGVDLTSGRRTDCGCKKFALFIGKMFGQLVTVGLDPDKKLKDGTRLIRCECLCGNLVSVRPYQLMHGLTKSCGCLARDVTRIRTQNTFGPKHHLWKGGIDKYGYKWVHAPEHPNSRQHGRIKEHTLVMSRILGRPLRPNETVHHRNGIRHDNRPENLELRVGHHGPGQRPEDLVRHAIKILRDYSDIAQQMAFRGELKGEQA